MDKNTFVDLAKEIYKLTLFFPKKEPLRYELRQNIDDIIADFIQRRNDYLENINRNFELIDSYFEIVAGQDWIAPAKISGIRLKCGQIKQELTIAEPLFGTNQIKTENTAQPAGIKMVEDFAPEFILVPEKPKSELIPTLPQDIVEAKIPAVPMINEDFLVDLRITGAEVEDAGISAEEQTPAAGQPGLTAAQIARQNRIMEFLKEQGSAQVWEIQKIFPSLSKRTIRRDFRSMLEQGLIESMGKHNTMAYKLKINLS